jgi:hypothetical protein
MNKEGVCVACGKENLTFNEVGLCKKLLGRKTERFFCIDCLAESLEVTAEELLAKVEEFKGQGCALFK